jgi:hypothetical protein
MGAAWPSRAPRSVPAGRDRHPELADADDAQQPQRGSTRASTVNSSCFTATSLPDDNRYIRDLAHDLGDDHSDVVRRLDPARRLGVERAELLQLAILLFGQELDAHGSGHPERAVLRLVLLAFVERFVVIADAPAARRAFRCTIVEKKFAGLLVVADDVRLAAGSFHFIERAELAGRGFEPCRHSCPIDTRVAAHIPLEARFQRFE